MLMASLPIAVFMERRVVHHRWADHRWSALGVVADPGGLAAQNVRCLPEQQVYLVPGLQLELHRDEDDGYFENWIAPAPKVFILWRIVQEHAVPVAASVSYGEGVRMLDSGELADGVSMPPEIHQWLGNYLRAYYQPRSQKKGHRH